MPPVDEETAGLREELGKIVEQLRSKQEAVRDDASLGTPGAKYEKDLSDYQIINDIYPGQERHQLKNCLRDTLIR